MGPAYAGLLCSRCMKPCCGLGLLGRKAMLYEQMDKTRPVSQRDAGPALALASSKYNYL